ncbi:BT4734/BF3469 family protein [Epilithonimonas sp. UC225_85]|uniref:BT4734/BF3469 family protein n=1 Tax=Epilithonimonas sp. UC225_85 TaxID=3350167 RepID=UPI0036D394A8
MEDLIFNEYKNSSTTNSVEISEKKIIEKIRSGFGIKGKIEKIRKEILKNGKSDISNKVKTELPAFIIAGIFSNGGRSKNNLLNYYGWMIFDIDNIKSDEEYQKIFTKLIKYPFVRTVFRSPSGNGMKIIVATDNKDSGKHTELYKKLMKHLESVLNIKFDSTCDVNRLCFYSYDPYVYHNENSEIFKFGTLEENFSNEVSHENIFETQFVNEIKFAIDFTNKVTKFRNNNRNNYIYLLSKNCCGYGLDKQNVIDYCIINFSDEDFDENEIILAIENGYQEKKSDFGKWKSKLERDIRTPKIEKNENRDSSNIYDFEKLFSNVNSTFLKNYSDILNQLKSEKDKEMYNLGVKTTLKSIFNFE